MQLHQHEDPHLFRIALRRAPPRLRLRGSDRALLVLDDPALVELLGAAQGRSTGKRST
jgi:hypothetical protein